MQINAPCQVMNPSKVRFLFLGLFFFKFHHQLCAVVEAVKESFVFVCCAEAAAQIEDGVVILQGYAIQQGIQFFEAVPYVRGIGFVGFLVGPVQLFQDSCTIRIAGVERAGLQMVLEQI